MKFSEITSNQSTLGHFARMWPKWTVRRPTPTPRSGKWKRLPKRSHTPRGEVWLKKRKGEEASRPPPLRTAKKVELPALAAALALAGALAGLVLEVFGVHRNRAAALALA